MPVRFQVDPDFYDHPKAIGMSDGATALWVRAGSYSAAKRTDGFVTEAALSLLSRCPAEAASELVERGLWRRVKGGFRFHQWDHRNLTRARIEADQAADRERKREERRAGRQNGKPQASGHSVHQDSPSDSRRSPMGVQVLSVSVSESVSESGSGRGPAEPLLTDEDIEPPDRCEKHIYTRNPPDCGSCADARKDHKRWEAARAKRIASLPRCPLHRGNNLRDNCGVCRSEELNPA